MNDLTEEQARQMEAGPELNKICSAWYRNCAINDLTYAPADCSTAWSAAGPLLEAMKNLSVGEFEGITLNFCSGIYGEDVWRIGVIGYGGLKDIVIALTPQLAIARACAVLVARGISRDELEVNDDR